MPTRPYKKRLRCLVGDLRNNAPREIQGQHGKDPNPMIPDQEVKLSFQAIPQPTSKDICPSQYLHSQETLQASEHEIRSPKSQPPSNQEAQGPCSLLGPGSCLPRLDGPF